MSLVTYYLNGVDLSALGIFVSKSVGMLNRPALKEQTQVDWLDRHGVVWGHRKRRFQPREFRLDCFMKVQDKEKLVINLTRLYDLFSPKGLSQLRVELGDGVPPLVYMVALIDEVEVNKTWSSAEMVATFELRLVEPEPVKRLLTFRKSDGRCSISFESVQPVTVYWGDGEVSYDVMTNGMAMEDRTYDGSLVKVGHEYRGDGEPQAFIVVTGDIEEMRSFSTNAKVLWPRY